MDIGKKLLSAIISITITLTAVPAMISAADIITQNPNTSTAEELSAALVSKKMSNTAPQFVSETFIDGSTFMLRNAKSRLYIGVADYNTNNNIIQREPDDIYFNTVFKLEAAGGGYYYIIHYIDNNGAYVLEVSDDGNIFYDKFKGTDAQKFMFTANSNGSYRIRSKISAGISCIDIQDGSTQAEANVRQDTENDSGSQDWILENSFAWGCQMDTNIKYKFKNKSSGLVMSFVDNPSDDPDLYETYYRLKMMEEDKKISQNWILDPFDHRYNVYNKYYIDAVNGLPLCRYNDSIEVRWEESYDPEYPRNDCAVCRFAKNLDGTYCIITYDKNYNDLYFEVSDAEKESGENVRLKPISGKDEQKWIAVTEVVTQVTTTTTTTATTATTTTTSTTTATTTAAVTSSETEAFPETTASETVTNTGLHGDVDLNEIVDLADVVMLAKYLLSSAAYPLENEQAYLNADVTHDDNVDILDLSKLIAYNLRLIPKSGL